MPGITERQLHHSAGLRNYTWALSGANQGSWFISDGSSGVPTPEAWAVGNIFNENPNGEFANSTELLACPRSMSVYTNTNSTVATRSGRLRVRGLNQFGEAIEEYLDIADQAASALVVLNGTKVFSRVYSVEVMAVSGWVAGDDIHVGIHSENAAVNQDIVWGLPVRIASSADILGGMLFEGGTAVDLDLSDITFIPDQMGIKLSDDVVTDSGSDRIIFIHLRTTY